MVECYHPRSKHLRAVRTWCRMDCRSVHRFVFVPVGRIGKPSDFVGGSVVPGTTRPERPPPRQI